MTVDQLTMMMLLCNLYTLYIYIMLVRMIWARLNVRYQYFHMGGAC